MSPDYLILPEPQFFQILRNYNLQNYIKISKMPLTFLNFIAVTVIFLFFIWAMPFH